MPSVFRHITRLTLKAADFALMPLGYTVVPKVSTVDYYLYQYESYEHYRSVQIAHNRRKLDRVWADSTTLDRVAHVVAGNSDVRPARGICHGSRNGFEQAYLNQMGWIKAIGTDISESATQFTDSIHWDFHDDQPEWHRSFDFVYSNSLDQSWKPRLALTRWLNQVKKGGLVIIEHSEVHGPQWAGEMDPFGVRPVVMPYVLTEWFGDKVSLSHSVAPKSNNGRNAWLFVCRRLVDSDI